MTDKLTDEQIKKALECCVKGNIDNSCPECPLVDYDGCMEHLVVYLADLINRLQAEIEMFDRTVKEYAYLYDKHINTPFNHIKAEAYKEFVERLKEYKCSYDLPDYHSFVAVDVEDIDNLLKELVGDENES